MRSGVRVLVSVPPATGICHLHRSSTDYNITKDGYKRTTCTTHPTVELVGTAVQRLPGGDVPEHRPVGAPLVVAAAGHDVHVTSPPVSGARACPPCALLRERRNDPTPRKVTLRRREVDHPLQPVRRAADGLGARHPERWLVLAALDVAVLAEDIHEALGLVAHAELRLARALRPERGAPMAAVRAALASLAPLARRRS